MTPLIQQAVRVAPQPAEEAMWFDVGQMSEYEGGPVPMDVMMHLPFATTAVAGLDKSNKPFSLWLTQGTDNVVVGGCSILHRAYLEPFAYIKTIDGIKFYRKNAEVEQQDIAPVMRMVAASLLKICQQGVAYRATPQRTFLNQKRIAKGKPPLSFDWHTVEIKPPAAKNDTQGGTHASPRLHDRRGHWRSLRSGKRVWVRDCKVGDASKGVVFKDYKVAA